MFKRPLNDFFNQAGWEFSGLLFIKNFTRAMVYQKVDSLVQHFIPDPGHILFAILSL